MEKKRARRRLIRSLQLWLVLVGAIPACAQVGVYTGRWDLTIETPHGELASWIEVSDQGSAPAILMVGETGHATPLRTAAEKDGELEFTATKDDQGFASNVVFSGRLVDGALQGTGTAVNGERWQWTGARAPALGRNGEPRWGKSVRLFSGQDLSGWKLRDAAKPDTWSAGDGTLVSHGRGSDLISTSEYGDFKLHVEFNAGPSANSGIYLRGRYEVQIETDSVAEPASHHTGGVYGFLPPDPEQPRKVDQWQSMDITLVGRGLTVVQNGVTVIANKEIAGITGGSLDSHEGRPGPVCLQGSEPGKVLFRNLVITPAEK